MLAVGNEGHRGTPEKMEGVVKTIFHVDLIFPVTGEKRY